MIWLNLDKSTKKCTIHTNIKCRYILNKKETRLKGINTIKKDGGWISFPDLSSTEEFCMSEYIGYSMSNCC